MRSMPPNERYSGGLQSTHQAVFSVTGSLGTPASASKRVAVAVTTSQDASFRPCTVPRDGEDHCPCNMSAAVGAVSRARNRPVRLSSTMRVGALGAKHRRAASFSMGTSMMRLTPLAVVT